MSVQQLLEAVKAKESGNNVRPEDVAQDMINSLHVPEAPKFTTSYGETFSVINEGGKNYYDYNKVVNGINVQINLHENPETAEGMKEFLRNIREATNRTGQPIISLQEYENIERLIKEKEQNRDLDKAPHVDAPEAPVYKSAYGQEFYVIKENGKLYYDTPHQDWGFIRLSHNPDSPQGLKTYIDNMKQLESLGINVNKEHLEKAEKLYHEMAGKNLAEQSEQKMGEEVPGLNKNSVTF